MVLQSVCTAETQAPAPSQDEPITTLPKHDGGAHTTVAGTFPHNPFTAAPLATEHARHAPEHGESQQYPSTQLPLLQSAGTTQTDPFGFGVGATQTPTEQEYPGAQSPGPLHEVRHALTPQTYGAQLLVPLGTQAPAPSQ